MPERRRKRKLMTVAEAAEELDVSEACIRYNIREGFLPAERSEYGYHGYMIDPGDFREFVRRYYQ